MRIIVWLWLVMAFGCDTTAREKITAEIQNLPSFKVLLDDSVSVLNSADITGPGSLVLFYFKGDCPSCKKETQKIIETLQDYGDTQFLFLTPSSFSQMKTFATQFNLKSHSNIIVANDYQSAFKDKFKPRSVPYVAIYNQDRKLIKVFSTPPSMENIRKAILM